MASMVVMGMGVTGRAVATALLRRNIDVVALDDRMSEELAAWSKETGITVAAPQAVDLSQILETSDGLLPAPGLPHHHPIFAAAHSQRFSPQVATWLNFGPDHLDAHDGLEAYEFAKASIWASLESGAVALANRDDDVVSRHAAAIAAFAPGAIVQTFGSDAPPTSVDHGIVDGSLVVGGEELLTVSELSRSLPHDLLNGLAATASTLPVGASRQAAADVLRGFDGLEHRVEHIATIGGVSYVNDSKATTPHAAAAALGGFDSIVLIAGGKNKGLAFDDMLDHVARIRHVVAIGDSAPDIEAVFAPHAATSVATSMEDAVNQASSISVDGDVVLLSPACASFDWFDNYKHRGRVFSQIVRSRHEASA